MHNNSRYNGSPALSPIGRNLQRLESNASMTNLLTPTRSSKSMLSSTRIITPQRTHTTPRYALSKPIAARDGVLGARSALSSTQFNSNSSFYTPSKVTKSPLPEESSPRAGTPTHQAKYGRAGLFPVVHFFQKKVPIIQPKQNSCVIKLSSNSPGLFDDSLDNAYEAQNHINASQTTEPSTRSVLDALKEISRKRIHGSEGYEKEKEKQPNEYSKRTREEDTSISPKSNATSPQQAPKRICVVDPIYASNTSSFCLKNNKRKLYECWLPSNENKSKRVMSVDTQTQTIEETKTPSVTKQNETLQETTTNPEQTSTTSNSTSPPKEIPNNVPKDVIDEYENETAASAQRAWDEKIYAIQKKNKLAIVLSRITGEEPKLIPVPRLWDKTNDVTDTALISGHKTNDNENAKIAVVSSSPAILNGPSSVTTTKTSESASSSSGISFGFPAPSVSKSSVEAPTATTASITAPISSSLSTTPVSINFNTGSTSSDISKSDAGGSSVPASSTSSLPSVNFVSGASNVSKPMMKVSETSSGKPTFAFGLPVISNISLHSTTASAALIKPIVSVVKPSTENTSVGSGFSFGSKPSTDSNRTLDGLSNQSSTSVIADTTKTSVSIMPFSKPSSLSTTNCSSSAFTTPTFTSANSKSIFGSAAVSSSSSPTTTTSAIASFPSSTPIFGGTSSVTAPASTNAVNGNVSFAAAFGLHPGSGPSDATPAVSETPKVSFDVGAPKKPSSPTGGFAFKLNEPAKSSSEISFGGNSTKSTTGVSATTTVSMFGSTGASTGTSSTSMFNSGTSGVFGATPQPATTTATFGALSTGKTFGGGFGTATTTAPPAFGTPLNNNFGNAGSGSTGFGATKTTTSTPAPVATFGSGGFGTPTKGSTFGGVAQPSGVPTFGGLTNEKKAFGATASSANTPALPGGFSFGGAPNTNAAPSTFGASATSSASSGFGSATSAPNTNNGNTSFGFGSSAPPAGSTFGTSSTSGFGSTSGPAAPAFGAKTTDNVFAFGNNAKPAQSTTSTPSSSFGFNASSAGKSTTGGSTFGQAAAGATTTGGGAGSGGGVFSFGSSNTTPATTNAPFAFGNTNNTTTTASSFGSSTGFGGSNVFGSAAPSADFGGTPNVNPFGKSTSATSAFGAPAPANTAQPPAFGSNMPSSTTPAFGASASSMNPPSFAAAFGQAPAPSNFNSSFGSAAPAAANSTFTFGASSSTPAFGSAASAPPPAFGSNTTMQPSNAFNFKAPAPSGAGDATKSSVFAFGSAEPAKPAAAGGFNFSAPGTSAPTAQNFGAAFGAPAPQQPGMFNIGASSAAPAKRTQLRAKRRT